MVAKFIEGRGQLLAEFTEVESGHKYTNRPHLRAALEECHRHRATLLIAKLDRLARNLAFIAKFMGSRIVEAADKPILLAG